VQKGEFTENIPPLPERGAESPMEKPLTITTDEEAILRYPLLPLSHAAPPDPIHRDINKRMNDNHNLSQVPALSLPRGIRTRSIPDETKNIERRKIRENSRLNPAPRIIAGIEGKYLICLKVCLKNREKLK